MPPQPSIQHHPTSWQRRYGWLPLIVAPAVVFGAMILLYGNATHWYFFRAGLPEFERARAEPGLMEPLAKAIGLPAPDLAAMDVDTARRIYDGYAALRRDPDDVARIRAMAETYRSIGDEPRAESCDALADTLSSRR